MAAELLKGAPVAEALNGTIQKSVMELKEKGVIPTLAIVRVGEKPDDIAYEKGAVKRAEKLGVRTHLVTLSAGTTQEIVLEQLQALNSDSTVHGILLFRPLPKGMDDTLIRNTIAPEKDVDGITDMSLAGVFTGNGTGFPPCTAQACIELLDHYGITLPGKRAVVIGRSLVIGKPAAMLLLGHHATVTICHTKTTDMPRLCREAEILIVSAGRAGMVDGAYLSDKQIVIDVGINVTSNGSLTGDVNFEEANSMVKAISPVPGGVGAVTTSVLISHVVKAAVKSVC
ncbi:MAG: bifunctional 5,10-methylene-tetrahydrofolate dehydrogenase/5,10-methylene-tetrahydrofolate cyclohydrolase [Spirochaetaceae bacterium]|jgi:methylenetetrahydrofolate dehydrogenase (NADP+)/methenyltetrahydrofolate cyclohydrolase|nr:bifunctional 5,10-methylene-tetrahydrofolate dehydrogenase/5,10-methylene-tetrahydrofolate cyclohydrolase [Spirochaetaceae bacterium]